MLSAEGIQLQANFGLSLSVAVIARERESPRSYSCMATTIYVQNVLVVSPVQVLRRKKIVEAN